tara:strand:- start:1787 stop:2149 length:363 start_codon:yes stop_codon:yes gene_type:complete
MSDTPRTDEATFQVRSNTPIPDEVVYQSFARQLERELAAVTADLEFRRELGTLQQQEYDKVTAERDALKAGREAELLQMAGYLSAELPALHSVEAGEIMRAVDAWIRREAIDAELAKEGK